MRFFDHWKVKLFSKMNNRKQLYPLTLQVCKDRFTLQEREREEGEGGREREGERGGRKRRERERKRERREGKNIKQ